MKLLSQANKASEVGMWIIAVIGIVAFLILLGYQFRTNRKHATEITELVSAVAVLKAWYGTQGENVEWIKQQLRVPPTVALPNVAHSPDVEQAVHMMMEAGVMRVQAYEWIYRAMDQKGKHPVAFAEKFVDLQRKIEEHREKEVSAY